MFCVNWDGYFTTATTTHFPGSATLALIQFPKLSGRLGLSCTPKQVTGKSCPLRSAGRRKTPALPGYTFGFMIGLRDAQCNSQNLPLLWAGQRKFDPYRIREQ